MTTTMTEQGARTMKHKHTPYDIDRAIRLGVHWQDHTPAELYVMAKDQAAMNRLALVTVGICVTAGSAMVAALVVGWV
jgi:hypothetical protein